MQTIGGREPSTASSAASTTRSRSRARSAASCRSCARRGAPLHGRRPRAHPGGARRDRARPDAEDPLLREGFVYEMLLAHELQHNETMLQLLQMVDGYEPVEADLAPPRRAVADGPEMIRSRVASTRSAPPARFRLRQRACPPRGRARALRDRPHSGDQRRLHAYVEETGAEPPMYWERDGEGGWVTRRDGPSEAVDPEAARHPRLLGGGRRLRPLGRQAAAHRARVGGGAATGSTGSATPGSGRAPTSSPTPASRPSLTRSTRRSSSATRTRCCAAAPGRPTRA